MSDLHLKDVLHVWLIRHGETEWSKSGQHTGRTDVPLTEEGRKQASELASFLGGQKFDLVLTSPMSRAIETCRLAGLGDQAQTDAALHEWNYGVYEGRTTPDIRKEVPDWSVWTSPIPEGESLAQVGARAQGLVDRFSGLNAGNVALFSHAHFSRVFAAQWATGAPGLGAHLVMDTAAVSIVGFERDVRAIVKWNVRG